MTPDSYQDILIKTGSGRLGPQFKTPYPSRSVTNLPQYVLPSTWNTFKISNDINCTYSLKKFKDFIKSALIDRYETKCTKKKKTFLGDKLIAFIRT